MKPGMAHLDGFWDDVLAGFAEEIKRQEEGDSDHD